MTILLRRTIRDHLRRSRPKKILNVFQRIRFRFFKVCGLASGHGSLASSRRPCRAGSYRNGAASEFEKTGLGAVLTHPTKPHTGFVKEGEAGYFQAIYPDLAVTQACIGFHNAHQDSPKRDFKLNDVMGAIVITIPVGQ